MQCASEITASGGHATLCTDATTKWGYHYGTMLTQCGEISGCMAQRSLTNNSWWGHSFILCSGPHTPRKSKPWCGLCPILPEMRQNVITSRPHWLQFSANPSYSFLVGNMTWFLKPFLKHSIPDTKLFVKTNSNLDITPICFFNWNTFVLFRLIIWIRMDCTDRTNPVDECLPSSAGHNTSEVTQVVRPACAICPKSFSTALGLRRHMARMHRQPANNCVAETADEPIFVYIIHCIYIVLIPCIICSNAHYTYTLPSIYTHLFINARCICRVCLWRLAFSWSSSDAQ